MDCKPLFLRVLNASRTINVLEPDTINSILLKVADAVSSKKEFIISENIKDLERMERSDSRYDRLLLTPARIDTIVSDVKNVSELASPLGKVYIKNVRPNGLVISKIAVPFGVIGIIFESRPNVTIDVFSLCLKSGNACILKGGSDAINSNRAIVDIIRTVLEENGIDKDIVALLPPGRDETLQLLGAREYVDLVIPRGSSSLIDYVRENASIPVIETGAGICHTYFDEFGDKDKGRNIVNNAKTRRVSVCNALDCLIMHEKRLDDIDYIVGLCSEANVTLYADERAYEALKGKYPDDFLRKATSESFGTEFLSYKMAIKTVDTFEQALNHINEYSSKHSEAIISENIDRINSFYKLVDAASVYGNASTAFTDGSQFGLGAEIGISTQKMHARGPMALEALTSVKWIIEGDGQIRQ